MKTLTFCLALIVISCTLAFGQTYKVLYSFGGMEHGGDGANPWGDLVSDSGGNLYGVTYSGGSQGYGSVFELSPNADGSWTESILHSFCTFDACTDGYEPQAGLVIDRAGNFYGTTSLGGTLGNGTVFEEKRSGEKWTESVIYNFTGGDDGASPPAGVTLDARGNLYGTSSFGGANNDGVIYELSRSGSTWKQAVLYTFQGLDDGQNPVGGVIVDQAGNLFGTTFDGGINGGGIVYELSPTRGGWTFTTLYNFTGSYGGPYNKLTLDPKGNIYSFTNGDGANGLGSVFKLAPSNGTWTFTDLHDFAGGSGGASPYGSVAVDKNGNVFGTAAVGGTQNQGLVFKITPKS